MYRLRLALGALLVGVACSGDCPEPERSPQYQDEMALADHHIGVAVLSLLRARATVVGSANELYYLSELDAEIRRLMIVLCGGATFEGRRGRTIDLRVISIDAYFDMNRLGDAQLVRCGGLVIRGKTQSGPGSDAAGAP